MERPLHKDHTADRNLVVLGCSATKIKANGMVPAVSLYDGPAFRVLRSFLREYKWPDRLSVAVLSAKHGLVGGLSHLTAYNQRMTLERAAELSPSVTSALSRLAPVHSMIDLVMGKDYLRTIDFEDLIVKESNFNFAKGAIGFKLNRLRNLLYNFPRKVRNPSCDLPKINRPLYFLPDWDDFLDVDYDFDSDAFSSTSRKMRKEEHSIAIMRPSRLCDGVLVSLAQHLGSKGLLRRVPIADKTSLAPVSVRSHFKLEPDQWAFGDCGAFSYASDDYPPITVERAVSVYDLYEFDLGASVDHIPVAQVQTENGKVKLTEQERRKRVKITRDNAQQFIDQHCARGAHFIPVGVIQGLSAKDYANQIPEYLEMGYRYLALGGLVSRSDTGVLEIVEGIHNRVAKLKERPWIHLLGIFRPSLQSHFRRLQVNSFDSATYFRKAWLRSEQNYLGIDGNWYPAIRIPPTRDPRTLQRLRFSGIPEKRIKRLEEKALEALHLFDRGEKTLKSCLKAITNYDELLFRGDGGWKGLYENYEKVLVAKPWKLCSCKMCRSLGIDVLIFRGMNRNKRRGAHNTLQLFRKINF